MASQLCTLHLVPPAWGEVGCAEKAGHVPRAHSRVKTELGGPCQLHGKLKKASGTSQPDKCPRVDALRVGERVEGLCAEGHRHGTEEVAQIQVSPRRQCHSVYQTSVPRSTTRGVEITLCGGRGVPGTHGQLATGPCRLRDASAAPSLATVPVSLSWQVD